VDTPSSPEVIEGNTLNFRPNFKFSTLKKIFFFGGGDPRSPSGCALGSLGQSLVRVKFEGAAPFKGRNIVSRKKYVMVYIHYPQ